MYKGYHTHEYNGTTSYNFGHDHGYCCITSYAPDIPGHVHCLVGTTTYDHGHTHNYYIVTGPEIEVAGGHIHYYRGATTIDNMHLHYMNGYTEVQASPHY